MRDTLTLGRFDRVVWLVAAAVLLSTMVVIWRGDQVGISVISLSPAPETVGISPRSQLRIQFDQRLDATSIDPNALVLTPSVAGEVRAEGDSLLFVPTGGLDSDTAYTVELAPGLASVQGHLLHDVVSWSFKTGRTSIIYSQVDENGKEQLMMAAVSLPAQGETADVVTIESPRQVSNANFGIWDFAVDANTGQVVFSVLNEDGTSDLWMLAPGATEPALLQACPGAACNSMAFSPNSQLLAFSQRNASAFGVPVVSPPRLWLLDLAAGTTVPVFADSQKLAFDPRWSGDGQWMSYLSPDLGGVGVYNLENGTERFYATTTGEAAVWNPLRNELILSEMLSGSELFEVHLFTIDPLTETRQDISLHEVPVEDNSPIFSPDGQWIAFRRKELDGPRASLGKQLWRMRADGSEAQPLTEAIDFDHGPPVWSPDSRYLLYHRFPLRGPEVTLSVWIMDVESGHAWEVARPGQRPQWVP
jgi:Tol biopolymer transport system component